MVSEMQRCWQRDPGRFATEALGATLWSKQREILEALRDHQRVAVASCHASGKTWTASVAAIWTMISFPDSIVVSTAPGGRQVEALLGAEIGARFADLRTKVGGSADANIGIPPPTVTGWHYDRVNRPKWYWTGFATTSDTAQDHASRFVGYHPLKGGRLLLVFDEAGGIERPIWQAADGLVTEENARWLAIGNPTDPTSEFAACWRDPQWHKLSISAFDCPNLQPGAQGLGWGVTRAWVEGMIRKYGEGSWPVESKVYGRFPTTSADTLISIGAVQGALGRAPAQCPHPPTSLSIGVDVARFGDDSTIRIVYCSACKSIVDVEERSGQDTQWTAGSTIAAATRHHMYTALAHRIAIDDTGLGGGVTDRMREEGWKVNAENFGELPRWEREDGERFINRRTELWWGLREWMPTACLGALSHEWHDDLIGDLTQIKYKYKGDQTIALEPKADLKKRIGRSPDFGDALALALAGVDRGVAIAAGAHGFLAQLALQNAQSAVRIGTPDAVRGTEGLRRPSKESYDEAFGRIGGGAAPW